MSGPAQKARALYILGDLFEAWIGDDAPLPPADTVAQALRSLADQGVQVGFLVGNRDFLLGVDYCRHAGMELLHEPVRVDHAGHAITLMHGDSLCIDDVDYQRFRQRVRDPAWQERMLSRPAWLRKLLARLFRAVSRRRNRGKPPEIMDVNRAAVEDAMNSVAVRNLIHGHTHRPAIHQLKINDQPALRAVLGDWHDNLGSTICLDQHQLRLMSIRRDGAGDIRLETEQISPLH